MTRIPSLFSLFYIVFTPVSGLVYFLLVYILPLYKTLKTTLASHYKSNRRIREISCIFLSGLQYTTSDNIHYVNRVGSMPGAEFTGVKSVKFKSMQDYKSEGFNPVCRAILASIRGPISSPSWKEKT